MSKHTIIQVDDKQAMLDALLAGHDEAKRYAQLCVQILVGTYGAARDEIDQETLFEGVYGHHIGCAAKGEAVLPPEEFLKQRLAAYSDYGLSKCGLTREQYEKKVFG